MLPKHPDQLTNAELDTWIRRLVDNAEPEGPRLDYKQEIHLNTVSQRREAAKDITSFANEIGGTLIYGVPERRTPRQAAPVPRRPYGIDSIPGLAQSLEDIFSATIVPLLPESPRILTVELSEYPGKVCYVIWTSESWVGPHMVQGYEDGRFYRRGQYRAAIMSERDVEERYRRRLLLRNAAEEFIKSDAASRLGSFFQRNQAKTTLIIAPMLFVPNRVDFSHGSTRQWLESNLFYRDARRGWEPTMCGVTMSNAQSTNPDARVELHHSGALVEWRYTVIEGDSTIHHHSELEKLKRCLGFAGRFYKLLAYTGPLIIIWRISCPAGNSLRLPDLDEPHFPSALQKAKPLEPSGTNITIRLEPAASELIDQPQMLMIRKRMADELARAFGEWEMP